jgi:hypothetical protein
LSLEVELLRSLWVVGNTNWIFLSLLGDISIKLPCELVTHSLVITLKYSTIADLHTLHDSVLHAH